MHPYIPHLLADIAAAHRTGILDEEETEQSIEAHFEAIDRWLSDEETEHTFGYYCGLNSEIFPPAEQLADEEMMIVRKAFDQMMLTWNHALCLPENLPVAFAYSLMVNSLNHETSMVNSGCMHLDFCCYYAPGCELKEYCHCLEIWNENEDDDMDIELKEDELPF